MPPYEKARGQRGGVMSAVLLVEKSHSSRERGQRREPGTVKPDATRGPQCLKVVSGQGCRVLFTIFLKCPRGQGRFVEDCSKPDEGSSELEQIKKRKRGWTCIERSHSVKPWGDTQEKSPSNVVASNIVYRSDSKR